VILCGVPRVHAVRRLHVPMVRRRGSSGVTAPHGVIRTGGGGTRWTRRWGHVPSVVDVPQVVGGNRGKMLKVLLLVLVKKLCRRLLLLVKLLLVREGTDGGHVGGGGGL